MRPIDRIAFHQEYFRHFKTVLAPPAVTGLNKLLTSMENDAIIGDFRWAAYMLATVKHECANLWLPITEFGKLTYFDKYAPHTALGKRLGNTLPGDGFRYRGRGFVQITGRANYTRMSKKLFGDSRLVDNPELALEHNVAYTIMSQGMVSGAFTSKKLADYIDGDRCDYTNARKIINGLDCAGSIAVYARMLEHCLNASVFVGS